MKKGCLVLLAIWGAVAYFYFDLFKDSELADQYWLPIVLGLAASMIAGNIQGVWLALKQRRVANTQPSQWKDGDFVVISGILSAIRTPINAPFSGRIASVVEYEVKANDRAGGLYSGFIMAPCSVMSNQGSVRLIGFPLLVEQPKETFCDTESYHRAGQYLSTCKFEQKSSNPLKLIAQLNAVLTDDDGDVKVDMFDKGVDLHLPDKIDINQSTDSLSQIISTRLENRSVFLEETIIPNGVEVTASGTYRLSRQAIDIGSGIKNISHSLKLGSAQSSTSSMLTRSLVTFIVISAIFIGANLFLLEQIGININELISRFIKI